MGVMLMLMILFEGVKGSEVVERCGSLAIPGTAMGRWAFQAALSETFLHALLDWTMIVLLGISSASSPLEHIATLSRIRLDMVESAALPRLAIGVCVSGSRPRFDGT